MKTYLLAMFALIAFTGCTVENPEEGLEAKKIELTAVQEQRVFQDNDFAFELLRKTIANTEDKNVFMSPLSVSLALGMVMNGANGTTLTEIRQVLGMNGMNSTDVNEYYELMQKTLPAIDLKTKLSLANSIWYRNGFNVKPSFLKINSDYFNATSQGLDFASPAALETINGWCSDNTNKLIPKVLDQIDGSTVMFLLNAIYFKGNWVTKFNKDKTFTGEFVNDEGKNTEVDMMQLKSEFGYYEDDVAEYLCMPYGNKAFSMIAILPDEGKSTDDVLRVLTAEKFSDAVNKMSTEEVQVYFPRFKVKNKFQLKPILQAMGMLQAFEPSADFGRISDNRPLWIDYVQHDTYVDVNEEGTEAAAVTTVAFKESAGLMFRADKPFLFVIREQSTGIILFVGKVSNPGKYS